MRRAGAGLAIAAVLTLCASAVDTASGQQKVLQPGPGPEIASACAAFLAPFDRKYAGAVYAYTGGGSPVETDRLFAEIRRADVVLLGEVHDNPVHHALQACLLAVAAEGRPAVVFEQITADEAAALAAYLAKPDVTAQGLGAAVGWETRGWPSWSTYQSIADVALANGLSLHAGDAAKATVRRIAREGGSALSADERERLGLERSLPEPAQAALLDELVASHCGVMPKTAFGGMALAQRYRDATLAAALVDARQATGRAVLIAGNGHVRSDRGVPWHLSALDPQARVYVIAIAEAEAPSNGVPKATLRDSAGRIAADAVIVTQPAERADPCEEMRARFGQKSEPKLDQKPN